MKSIADTKLKIKSQNGKQQSHRMTQCSHRMRNITVTEWICHSYRMGKNIVTE